MKVLISAKPTFDFYLTAAQLEAMSQLAAMHYDDVVRSLNDNADGTIRNGLYTMALLFGDVPGDMIRLQVSIHDVQIMLKSMEYASAAPFKGVIDPIRKALWNMLVWWDAHGREWTRTEEF